ncbi:thiamine ABC transporter substrate binding subunit [Candidatus Liberibacter africanus]|uniref:thiamine ABC transporter substrate binding subunit n=1 Tax=Liberibacter africanus TaxID=34020 RepID=UPI00069C6741|nr:thiamine ABC transporter substrate binding subunit [Candidatus Liberibacter africanus]
MKIFVQMVVGATIIALTSYYTFDGLQAKPILTVYTYNSFFAHGGMGSKIKLAFEETCGCELRLIGFNGGVDLLNRLRIERENSPADLVLGLDYNLIDLAKKTGLFDKSYIDISQLKLPIKWNDDVFVPYDYGYLAFIYDKRHITQPPKSFDEFINSTEPWKIIYQDPRTSTLGLGLLLWIQKIYGDKSAAIWKKIATKTAIITKGWSEAYGLFLKGESDFVLSYSSSPAFHIFNDGQDNYGAVLFNEGHYLQVEVVAQLRSGRNPQLAQKFMQFIISPFSQKFLSTTNWMYPVIDVSMPEVYRKIKKPTKSLQLKEKDIIKYRNQWIYSWQNAISYP